MCVGEDGCTEMLGKAIATIAALVTILVGLQALGWWPFQNQSSASPPTPAAAARAATGQEPVFGPAEITLSASTAPRGGKVTVYGSGFQPAETVDIRVHVTVVGSATADSSGKFTQQITIPQSAPPPGFPTDISATGHSSIKTGSAPFSTS